MSAAQTLAGAAIQGVRLAAAFNPYAGALTAALAAFLAGSRTAGRRAGLSAGIVVLGGWLLGDGAAFAAAVAGAAQARSGVAAFATLAVWSLGGIALGYALPAVIGVAVGRRVFLGTGRMAATAIAVGSSLAIAALTGAPHVP